MINTDFSHWLGLVQTDGNIRLNKNGEIRAIEFTNKNVVLINKFSSVCKYKFGRSPKVNFNESRKSYSAGLYGLSDISDEISKMQIRDPPSPALGIDKDPDLFGAYIAGIIDGDGDVRIKRKRNPQCVIRITSGSPQTELKKCLEDFIQSKISITHRKIVRDGKAMKNWHALEFYVSSKNIELVRNYIMPYILSDHKSAKLESYINLSKTRPQQ